MVCLTVRNEIEISKAIRECVGLCLKAGDVQQCIENCAKDLKAKGWLNTDLVQFKQGTRYVLAYLQQNDTLFPDLQLEEE